MSKRISKKVREEAAFACGVAASNDFPDGNPLHLAEDGFISNDAEQLAWSAASAANRGLRERKVCNGVDWIDGRWAEAEALLRTGWSP